VLFASVTRAIAGVSPQIGSTAPEAKKRMRSAGIGEPILIFIRKLMEVPGSRPGQMMIMFIASRMIRKSFDHVRNCNLAINRITGSEPPDIHGVTINSREEYGHETETRKEDLAMWKGCGIISLDGVL